MRKFEGGKLLIATHNAGKLEEMRGLLAPSSIEVVSGGMLGLPEPEETESTFIGNARIKAHAAARATGLIALGDDSGLEVDALGGQPGVQTADWAEAPTGRDVGMAMAKVHTALVAANAETPWRARFRCTLGLAWPDGHDEVFEGVAEGSLIWPVRGAVGHGFDPMFVPADETRTYAEMSYPEKNSVSHRAQAIRAMMAACFT